MFSCCRRDQGVEIVEKRHGVSVRLLGALRSVVAAAATEGDQEEDAKLHTEALNKARLIQVVMIHRNNLHNSVEDICFHTPPPPMFSRVFWFEGESVFSRWRSTL